MAVNIEVDEPEIDIRVRTYDGYVEVTGISAPLSVGDAQVVKGDLVDAGPATTALVVGDAETTKGRAVEGGTSTALVTGDGQTDKGSAVSADGTSTQTVVGDAETDKGEATQGGGVNAPLAVGEVQTEHLKPTHRWQMPQPRNLLSDPESFDPGSTGWESSHSTYAGTVDNVGPNGEAAHRFDIGTSVNWAEIAKDGTLDLPSYQPLTVGFLVRAVNVDLGLQVRFKNQDFSESSAGSTTVTTDWQWVVGTNPNGGAIFVRLETQYDTSFNESLYILRAGLNRGSTLEYSTRSAVPQEIPDVVQGADLSNGSTDSADTNDLDFGVDSQGVPYAVSDGDDKAGNISASLAAADKTWAFRFYLPASGSWQEAIIGDRNDSWEITAQSQFNILTFRFGRDDEATIDDSAANYSGWNTAAVTIKNGESLRFNLNGTVEEESTTATNAENAMPLIRATRSGMRVQHIEPHPVLTEAEAEAVRQRLARNPADPVAKTEAWDFTAETSPHNYVQDSKVVGGSGWEISRATVNTDVATDPEGNTTADALIEDTSTNSSHFASAGGPTLDAGDVVTFSIWVKANGRRHYKHKLGTGAFSGNGIDIDLIDGTIEQVNDSGNFKTYGLSERGNGWYRVWLAEALSSDGAVNGISQLLDSNLNPQYDGDGSSGVYLWGASVVRGATDNPIYAPTNGSIAFPQTVPSLTGRNDLTLGSGSGADTNDPDWVAPYGITGDSDDYINAPVYHNSGKSQATWHGAFEVASLGSSEILAGQLGGRGWQLAILRSGEWELRLRDSNGDEVKGEVSGTFGQGTLRAWTLRIDGVNENASLFIDSHLYPIIELDFSILADLIDSESAKLYRPLDRNTDPFVMGKYQVHTRALTDEQALYARQRILDNPTDPFPNYTTP